MAALRAEPARECSVRRLTGFAGRPELDQFTGEPLVRR